MKADPQPLSLMTAGGKIRCTRCTALSKRSGLQCGRPALNASRTQKCQFHGGRGSGPKTDAGRLRVAEVNTVHGRETQVRREERARKAGELAQLEDALYLLGMLAGPRTRGRKPTGYEPLTTVDQVLGILRGGGGVKPRGGPARR